MVHVTWPIDLWFKVTRSIGTLLANKDMEVIICSMSSGVTFCANRRSEEDQVLGEGGVKDIHSTHCATGIVEEPFRAVSKRVLIHSSGNSRVQSEQTRPNILEHGGGVLMIDGNNIFGNLVDFDRIKDIPTGLGAVSLSR